jgi:hypothetical protein
LSYRDDLDAAQARAAAAERRAAELQKQLDAAQRAREADDANEPLDVPIPQKFVVDRRGDSLSVSWRWYRAAQHLPLFAFCIAWDAFLVYWYFAPEPGEVGWLHYVFPIAHVSVGLFLSYTVLAGLFNRTIVSASRGALKIQHTGLPWPGNRELPRDSVRQLYVKEERRRAKRRSNDDVVTYDLCALLESQREVELLDGLEELGHARYLERVFEQHLGIKDRTVPDEVPKP